MKLRQFLLSFRRAKSGAAALEFALVVPILLTLLFAIIQFGSVVFVQNNMVNAAREGARRIAAADVTSGEATTMMQNMLGNWNLPFTYNIALPNPANPADRNVVVTVSVPAIDARIVSYPPGLFGSGNLVAQVTMRQEDTVVAGGGQPPAGGDDD